MKIIILQLINFQYFCSRKMGALGSEAADRVSDGHAKKLGKGMSPTNTVGILIYYFPFNFQILTIDHKYWSTSLFSILFHYQMVYSSGLLSEQYRAKICNSPKYFIPYIPVMLHIYVLRYQYWFQYIHMHSIYIVFHNVLATCICFSRSIISFWATNFHEFMLTFISKKWTFAFSPC